MSGRLVYMMTNTTPLRGHDYHRKTDAELRYIVRDAGEAAICMRDLDPHLESKYLDQVNDAETILHWRQTAQKH